jgi:hypothetical protein
LMGIPESVGRRQYAITIVMLSFFPYVLTCKLVPESKNLMSYLLNCVLLYHHLEYNYIVTI